MLERIHHYKCIYQQVLQFVERHGACLAHAQPKYFLKYNDYVLYEKYRPPEVKRYSNHVILDENAFYLRSKQCWLDLILQIFKVFVLPSVLKTVPSPQAAKEESPLSEPETDPEKQLKSWATYHYNKNKSLLCHLCLDDGEVSLNTRTVKNFEKDFEDGLIIVALILSYLPYLEEYLQPIYINVDTPEKAFHNAARIVNALKMINSSFPLRARSIQQPYSIEILMFLTYIFEIFPYFQPTNTLTFHVSLSKTKTEEITLKNVNSHKVFYRVIILNNDLEYFTTNCGETLDISANKTVKILVTFQAKTMSKVKSTLIFCGEVPGDRYAKSIVYSLEGDPNFENEHECLCYKLPLYQMVEKSVSIQSPYVEKAEYEIATLFQQPDIDTFIGPNKPLVPNMKLKIANINESTLKCDENGTGEINITVACMCSVPQELWIFFLNKHNGDFFIKVELIPTQDPLRQIIPVLIPINFKQIKCVCKDHNKLMHPQVCPRILTLRIPIRNTQLWDVIFNMFMAKLHPQEVSAWKQTLDCSEKCSADVMDWLGKNELDNPCLAVRQIFKTSVEYLITGPKDFVLPSSFTIQNVTDIGCAEIYMHVPNELPRTCFINLKSVDGIETRLYTMKFTTDDENEFIGSSSYGLLGHLENLME